MQKKIALEALVKQRTAEVLSDGLIIETALNPEKQWRDEQTISALLKPEGVQAGAAVIDNETREIVSLFAGKDYKKAGLPPCISGGQTTWFRHQTTSSLCPVI